jgi:putative addiction module component (TIGR02574 family)
LADVILKLKENAMTTKSIEQNLLKLPPLKRLHIIESLIASLNKPDPTVERAWGKESDRRLKEYKSGRVKAVEWKAVKKRFMK